jgi:hypothetical protein
MDNTTVDTYTLAESPLLAAIPADDRDALVSRREAIARGAKSSALMHMALAAGSVPVALAALSSEVYGQAPAAQVTSVLQFALLLENLEAEFYKTVTAGGTGFSAANNPQAGAFAPIRTAIAALPAATRDAVNNTLTLIRDHEIAHVALLRSALGANAGPVLTGTAFDFTGGRNPGTSNGPFLPATQNLALALAVTQAFEDTGVRAYKGQAPNLIRTATLETALRIHAMEARHASRIRRIRRALTPTADVLRYSGTVRGGGAAAGGPPANPPAAFAGAFEAIYGGATSESNVAQGGVTVTGLGGTGANAAGEAFDEPLTRAEVTAIVQPFVVANVPTA